MFKIFAAILLCAVCMSPIVEGAGAAVVAKATPVQNLSPQLLRSYGYDIGRPLLVPDMGPLTSLLAAAMPPRTYIAQSNPAVIRTPCGDNFIGEGSVGVVVV